MLTTLDLAAIALLLIGGMVALETSHRVDVVAPAVAEPVPELDPACANARRFLANRLVFLSSGEAATLTLRQAPVERVTPPPGCR